MARADGGRWRGEGGTGGYLRKHKSSGVLFPPRQVKGRINKRDSRDASGALGGGVLKQEATSSSADIVNAALDQRGSSAVRTGQFSVP